MAKKLERVSQREYAQRLGLSNTAVSKAIDEGKIVKGYDPKTKQIIVEHADKEWGLLHKKTNITALINDNAQAVESKNLILNGDSSFADAKRVGAIIQAQLLALELKKEKGELVKKADVFKQLYSYGQQIRTSLQAIPDRCTDNILASKSRAEAHNIISTAIYEVLEGLTTVKDFNFQSN